MNIIIFMIVAILSTLGAILFEYFFTVAPSKKDMLIERYSVRLAQCLNALDKDAMLHGKISNGDYLHDRFYKSLFFMLCRNDILNTKILFKAFTRSFHTDEQKEKDRKKLRAEVEALDAETKEIVEKAIIAVCNLLLLRMSYLLYCCVKKTVTGNRDLQLKAQKSAERISIDRNLFHQPTAI